MTNEEINKAIAEKVMGKCWHEPREAIRSFQDSHNTSYTNYCPKCETFGTKPNKDFCTDISAAWQVVEKMREKGFMYDLFDCYEATETHGCTFTVPVEPEIDEIIACEHADTAPLAICLAALRALS